jgi:hypothetical protein
VAAWKIGKSWAVLESEVSALSRVARMTGRRAEARKARSCREANPDPNTDDRLGAVVGEGSA